MTKKHEDIITAFRLSTHDENDENEVNDNAIAVAAEEDTLKSKLPRMKVIGTGLKDTNDGNV